MEAYDSEDPVTKRVNAFGKKFQDSQVKCPNGFIKTLIDAAYPKPTDPFLFGRRPDKAGIIAALGICAWEIDQMNITNLAKWWTTFVVNWTMNGTQYGSIPEKMWQVVEQILQE